MSLQTQIEDLNCQLQVAGGDDVFLPESDLTSFHDHADDLSIQDSFEDYSEDDLRAQINVLQRENLNLRSRLDNTNLVMLEGLQTELVDLQAKYLMVMEQKQHLGVDDSGEFEGTEVTAYQGLVAEADDNEVYAYEPTQRHAGDEDYIDWKLKCEALEKQNQALLYRIDSVTRSPSMNGRSQSVENLRGHYETIMQENEILRAKLGSFGHPTESTPEEDESFDFATKFDAVMKENENLKTKLGSYSMTNSEERDEDWKAHYDQVLQDYESMRENLEDATLPLQDALLQGIQDLQALYDHAMKEKENVQVKLDSICEQAEKDFSEHQAKHNRLLVEHQALKSKFRKARDKSKKEHNKIKARFVAASKEIAVLKDKSQIRGDIDEDKDANDNEKHLDGAKTEDYVTLKRKYSALIEENKTMKNELGTLKGRAMESMRSRLRLAPVDQVESIAGPSYAESENLGAKYSEACQEITNLRAQLDTISGRMLDDLSGYQAETEALAERNQEMGRHMDDTVQAAHMRIAKLQSQCQEAIEGEDSVTESIDWNTSLGGNGSDSDTSADSLNLEMETDYEVLVQEYERLKASGAEEIQRAYEAVVGHGRLESNKKPDINEQDIAGEAKVTPNKGETAKLTKRSKAKKKTEVVKQSVVAPLRADDARQTEHLGQQSPVSLDRHTNTTSQVMRYSSTKAGIQHSLVNNVGEYEEMWQMVSDDSRRGGVICNGLSSHTHDNLHEDGLVLSNGILNSESESSDLESEVCDQEHRNWSVTENEELQMHIEDLVVHIDDDQVRGYIRKELVELCRKCCSLAEENEYTKTCLKTSANVIAELRLESHRQMLDQTGAFSMTSSWDSVPELREAVRERLINGYDNDDFHIETIEKLKSELKDLKRIVSILRAENQNLIRENCKKTSMFESQTAKASWEISLMKNSYEDEIEELKHRQGDIEGETFRLREALYSMKRQYESLAKENEDLETSRLKIRHDLEDARRSCSALLQEKKRLESTMDTHARFVFKLQEAEQLQATNETVNGSGGGGGGGLSDGSQSPKSQGDDGGAEQNGTDGAGGGDDSMNSSGSSGGGASPNGGSDIETDLPAQKSIDELIKENEDLRQKLKAKCLELQQLQSFQRTYHTLVNENQEFKKEITEKAQELTKLKSKNRSILNENETLEIKLNEAILKSSYELDELKKRKTFLEQENKNLLEKLDKDILKAEKDLTQWKKKCTSILQEKDEIEFEYKTCKEKSDKDLANLIARYEEVCSENERLTAQINKAKTKAEKEVVEAQVSVEDMVVETETMQAEFNKGRVKNKKEIEDLRTKVFLLKKEKRDIKLQVDEFRKETESIKEELTRSCHKLSEENNTLRTEAKETNKKYEAELKEKEETIKKLDELSKSYAALERFHEDIKFEMTSENIQLKNKLSDMERDYEAFSKTNEELKGTKTSLMQELHDSQGWCELMESKMKDLEDKLKQENEELKYSLKTTQDELHVEAENRKVLECEREDLLRKLDALQKMYNMLELSYDDHQKGNKTEVDKFRQEMLDMQNKYEDALASSRQMALVKGNTVTELKVMEERFHGLENEKGQMMGEMEILKIKVQRLEERQKQLLDLKTELTQERDKASRDLKDTQAKYRDKEREMVNTQESLITDAKTKGNRLAQLQDKHNNSVKELEQVVTAKKLIEKEYQVLLEKFTILEISHVNLQKRSKENEAAKERADALSSVVEDLKREQEEITSLRDTSMSESEHLRYVNDVLEEEKEQAMASKTALAGELEGLMSRLECITQEKDDLTEKLSELQKHFDTLQDEVESKVSKDGEQEKQQEGELVQLRKTHQQLLKKFEEVGRERDSASTELMEIQSKYHGLQDMYERTKQQFGVEEQTLRNEMKSLQQTRAKYETLSDDHAKLQRTQHSSVDELEDVKSKMRMLESLLETAKRMTDMNDMQHEYFTLQEKYLNTLRENEMLERKLSRTQHNLHSTMALHTEPEVSDIGYSQLLRDNNKLAEENGKLENELKSQRTKCVKSESIYTEVTELRQAKKELEENSRAHTIAYRHDRDSLEKRLSELQSVLDDLAESKGHVESDLEQMREKYMNAMALKDAVGWARDDVVMNSDTKAKMHAAIIETAELQNKLKDAVDQRDLVKVELTHLKKECQLYERHVRDLEKEVESQCYQLTAVTRDHKDVVKLFSETRLELEIYRSKHRREINKVEDLMHRVEANLQPSRVSPRIFNYLGRVSPHLSGSGHSTPRSSGHRSRDSSCSIHSLDDDGSEKTTLTLPEEVPHSLEMKHVQMVEEISQLRSELTGARSSSDDSSGRLSHSPIRSPIPMGNTDILTFREELTVISDRNNELLDERDELQQRLREQEELVLELQKQANTSDPSENRLAELFNHQLIMLRQQRDHLIHRLEDDRERDQRILDLIREKGTTEERFRQERDQLRRKLHEKTTSEKEMKNKITTMEKHIRKQQQLEELVQQKEELEGEISQQKQALENELGDVERKINERGSVLRSERFNLMGETDSGVLQSASMFSSGPRVEFTGVPPDGAQHVQPMYQERRKVRTHISDHQVERLTRMKSVVERRYKVAIDRLRNELKQDVEAQKKHLEI